MGERTGGSSKQIAVPYRIITIVITFSTVRNVTIMESVIWIGGTLIHDTYKWYRTSKGQLVCKACKGKKVKRRNKFGKLRCGECDKDGKIDCKMCYVPSEGILRI